MKITNAYEAIIIKRLAVPNDTALAPLLLLVVALSLVVSDFELESGEEEEEEEDGVVVDPAEVGGVVSVVEAVLESPPASLKIFASGESGARFNSS